MKNIIFLILTLISHIGASFFFAKPRFHKVVTAVIWLTYGGVFLILDPEVMLISYFVPFFLHMALFFITTKGRPIEKGFLFLSYATAYTCFTTLFNIFDYWIDNIVLEIIICILLMGVLQVILYTLLLPSFNKVAASIRNGWGMFYAVVISFLSLFVVQTLLALNFSLTMGQSIIFLLTVFAFCVTYIALFSGMKNIVRLSREKQKSLHTDLLQAQVDAQALEAQLVRQNRHDMRFHYQALMTLAKSGEIDKIVDYIELQSESLEATTTERFCENETVNNVLKVFKQKAIDKNVSMDIRAAVKPDVSVPSPTLVTVVANVLENALHGAIESKVENPTISVSIKHKSGRLVITCENTCLRSLAFDEMPEHLQGIGVHSIISSAEKHNGSFRFSASDGLFRCVVVMDE